jgi:hypothetical protein
MIFKVADIDLGLFNESDREYSEEGGFPGFTCDDAPQAKYQVRVEPVPARPSGNLVFDSEQAWRLFDEEGRRILWISSLNFTPYLVGNFSSDYRNGEIFTTRSTRVAGKYIFPLGRPLGELLMINLLGTGYGLMLHSCGVIDAECGIVFAGISTAGKTTTARLWNSLPGVRVVNDDRTILRKKDGQFRVYGTPWYGQGGIALAEDAPLKKIFILKHAPFNQAVRLTPARAAAALLVRTFPPLWSAEGMAFTLQFLEELCLTVPCYELGFVPNMSMVEYVRCLTTD